MTKRIAGPFPTFSDAIDWRDEHGYTRDETIITVDKYTGRWYVNRLPTS